MSNDLIVVDGIDLAAYAAADIEAEKNVASGKFIKTRGGMLSINGAPLPNNELFCVVIGSVSLNTYYTGKYDPNNTQTPVCYGFGDNPSPHPQSTSPQCESCAVCPHNVYGTSESGKGKACKNVKRLAVLPWVPDFDAAYARSGETFYLNLPVMSTTGYGQYVKRVVSSYKLPLFAIKTCIKPVQDMKSQFKITFNDVGVISDAAIVKELVTRYEAQRTLIEFPFQEITTEPETKKSKKF